MDREEAVMVVCEGVVGNYMAHVVPSVMRFVRCLRVAVLLLTSVYVYMCVCLYNMHIICIYALASASAASHKPFRSSSSPSPLKQVPPKIPRCEGRHTHHSSCYNVVVATAVCICFSEMYRVIAQ